MPAFVDLRQLQQSGSDKRVGLVGDFLDQFYTLPNEFLVGHTVYLPASCGLLAFLSMIRDVF